MDSIPIYTISISLTPSVKGTEDKADQRTLSLVHNEPLVIGRASKSDVKNLQRAKHNALFDCPVISRQHAEIQVHPYKARHEQVTITDKDSMHGTFVNMHRLKAYEPWVLRTGDSIKLGDKVTRGYETHQGTDVIYRRCDEEGNPWSYTTTTTTASRTFAVPSESGDESDGSSIDAPILTSSANTTPEQPKVMLGSQQKPIDVENNTSLKTVIHLDDDDELSLRETVREEAVKPRLVVKDTYDTEDVEDESAVGYNTCPSQLLGRVAPVDEDDDEDAASETSSQAYLHLSDHDSTHSENGDNLSDSDASDISGFEAPDIILSDLSDDEDDEDGPEEMSSAKQPSPELGGPPNMERVEDSIAVAPTVHRYFTGMAPPQTRYDPVRSSDAPLQRPMASQQPRAAPAYTRWDVPPGNNTVEQAMRQGTSALPRPHHSASVSQPLQPYYAPAYHPQYTFVSQPSRVPPPHANWNDQAPLSYTKQRDDNHAPAPETVRHKLSIPAIVEQTAAEKEEISLSTMLAYDCPPASKLTSMPGASVKPSHPATSTAAAGSKRKADEISTADDDDEGVEAGASNDLKVTLSNAELLHLYATTRAGTLVDDSVDVILPPQKKARLTKTDALDVAKGVAKYAAAAAAGGAGMVAFLASPYAQQLLDWLA
ncbi:hypothetical protein B0A55_05063 [Friedmanniomyces simplex]|uniref:FHA domain-containing protein n=1 Tax=Friedmanniomyces simplex TaxID=329884 RepID=A0A4U0XIE6_9PEZI|nr:hypothetical protein B0A55_05063 [Friedmanniomyces simplex]